MVNSGVRPKAISISPRGLSTPRLTPQRFRSSEDLGFEHVRQKFACLAEQLEAIKRLGQHSKPFTSRPKLLFVAAAAVLEHTDCGTGTILEGFDAFEDCVCFAEVRRPEDHKLGCVFQCTERIWL